MARLRAPSIVAIAIAASALACQFIAGTSKTLPGPDGDGGSGCTTDADCTHLGGCAYSRCNTSTRECTDTASYGDYLFERIRVDLGGATLSCKTDLRPCIAVRYPFLYVGTEQGPMRATISDPKATDVVATPVAGAPTQRTYVAGAGPTIYFTADYVASEAGASHWGIAWLTSFDGDLGVTSITAPMGADYLAALGAPPTSEMLVFAGVSGQGWRAAASVNAPIAKDPKFEGAGFGGISGDPVAVSGTRTLFHAAGQTMAGYRDRFTLADALGTSQGHALAAATDVSWTSGGLSQFAVGDDGSVVWLTTVVPDPMTGVQTAARVWWLVDGLASLLTDDARRFDAETFTTPAPPNTPAIGPVAWTDPQTALVVAQDSATRQAAVSVVSRVSLPPAVVDGSRRVENVPLGTSSTFVTSHGYAYLVSVEGAAGSTLRVRGFAPACVHP